MDSTHYQKTVGPELAKTSALPQNILGSNTCEATPPEVSPKNPLRDLRGAWLTSVFNLDWPTSRTATPAVQQADLLKILDTLRNAGFNTVFLQVRTGSDALYASPHEPWSYYLTGTEGMAPSPFWDPLAFAVSAAHARGLDIHAWINPYRARTGSFSLSPNHVINQNPSWILTIGSNLILNPGLPQVRTHITTIVADIATRYDVDGIHFDDYFYPSAINTEDAGTYAAHNPKGIPTVADWRRDNVNQLIAKVYDTLQQINQVSGRNLVFGVSPFGIWKSGTPAGISGTSSYSAFYCDPIAWLQAGKVDYLSPQLYWKLGGAQDYSILSQWWNDQGKQYGRHIYPGLAWYKMVDANNWPASEIENQIYLNRQPERNEIRGEVGYRTAQLMADSKGLKTALQQGQYRYKSYAPAFGWKDNTCPNAPTQLWLDGDTLRWQAPSPAADGDTAVKYVVYRYLNDQEAVVRKQDGTRVVDIVATSKLYLPQAGYYRYVVSALDKNNNESDGIMSAMPNVVLCPGGSLALSAMITGASYQCQSLNNGNWEVL
ncbi:MAG TPA: family 10 glycosylhydrolase, partial [Phnomibacter sp.]|nr:family 10 glycosylhydrolase [Phnomibacter sp.]